MAKLSMRDGMRVGDLARRYSVPPHIVANILYRANIDTPRIGGNRVMSESVVEFVREQLIRLGYIDPDAK